ncbi:MAG: arginine--tRNA ligase [Candidatus Marinimicrobia bacterium]|jgi:arginyl-tRNA synthetase|nr:arginine--tRNA ligase [Candidatus Neomarinimicrobiota bacterium]MDP6726761.1 arginine--tRNA ligase [Candidatus Neomarinimicrobiota bacterium]|tara:strand:- start:6602 stop:8230 length:1629 start_codon:yes stop_codon:yes gene_type:complete
MKLKEILQRQLTEAAEKEGYTPHSVVITSSKDEKHGDLSSSLPLSLAKAAKKPPMEIAESIIGKIEIDDRIVADIFPSPPGFINFKINPSYYQSLVSEIIKAGNTYGQSDKGKNKTANVEFVSANPTGPLTIGHGRNAVIGDTVANILENHGYNVTREYYFNDAGRQMRLLGQSVEARYFELVGKEIEFPNDGYEGNYIKDIAQSILDEHGKSLLPSDPLFKENAEKIIFADIENSLVNLGIHFDQFTNEKTFYENGEIDRFLEELKAKNLIYEKDDATWFRTTELGKDQDRVYIKSTGEPTYRVPDTAYHRDKVNRGFDLIIDIFGADHADTYPDVLLALEALGLKTDHIRVLLYQFVTLLRNGEKIKMSTRKANFITMDELVNEVSADVVRYFFIMRSMNSHLNFDLDLATDHSEKNPVFYLQYAHARICNIIKRGAGLGKDFTNDFDSARLTHSSEIELLKTLEQFPEIMSSALKLLEPQDIANYLQDLAARFHRFYVDCRVITDDNDLSAARVALIKATKIVLANGLNVLGLTAPERM